MKILVCPDSFKGTLEAADAARLICRSLEKNMADCVAVPLPIADGGEGTLDCFESACGGERISVEATNGDGERATCEYLLLPDGRAVVELAKIAGLPMAKNKNPAEQTTFGVGEVIRAAARRSKKILLAIGGSATNDGGAGIAAAMGAKFFDKNGRCFVPVGGTLALIDKIDISELVEADITCVCDVENLLYGENGAAYVFAPQKGADAQAVQLLDSGLRHFSAKLIECISRDVSELPGGGAAGGVGAGMAAFFFARLEPGVDIMLKTAGFAEQLDGASLVVTGEGRLDKTSFSGKAVGGVLAMCRKHGVPVAAICGCIAPGLDPLEHGLVCAEACFENGTPMQTILTRSSEALEEAAKRLCLNYKITER